MTMTGVPAGEGSEFGERGSRPCCLAAGRAHRHPRNRRAYGVPSGVNNILIINKAVTPGRITAIIVKERLGF